MRIFEDFEVIGSVSSSLNFTENGVKYKKVIKEGKVVKVASKNLRVGDIIKLDDGETVPADLVLLCKFEPNWL